VVAGNVKPGIRLTAQPASQCVRHVYVRLREGTSGSLHGGGNHASGFLRVPTVGAYPCLCVSNHGEYFSLFSFKTIFLFFKASLQ
jgi:hypothetical protein